LRVQNELWWFARAAYPDMYSRLRGTAALIDNDFPDGGTLLNVGDSVGLIGVWLPKFQITLVDLNQRSMPREYACKNVVDFARGDFAQEQMFSPASFDVCTSTDALEHVPRDRRAAFVRSLLATARSGVYLSCPVAPGAGDIEWLAAFASNRDLFATSLAEHALRGLPTLDDLREYFNGTQFTIRPLTSTWTWLMSLLFKPGSLPDHIAMQAFNAYANSTWVEREIRSGVIEDVYRVCVIALREPTARPISEPKVSTRDLLPDALRRSVEIKTGHPPADADQAIGFARWLLSLRNDQPELFADVARALWATGDLPPEPPDSIKLADS
jgi:hypothetical protein